MEDQERLQRLADVLAALSSERRLGMLRALAETPLSVGEVSAEFQVGQSVASQNLAKLKSAGLVTAQRNRQMIIYRADPAALAELRRGILQLFPEQEGHE